MNRFIFIDTCIFVQYCVLETEEVGPINEALKTIRTKLDGNAFKLLLPEVVELEFPKTLNRKMTMLETEVKKIKLNKNNVKPSIFTDKMIDEMNKKINEFITERQGNISKTKANIETIFNHKNTIRIPLTPDMLLDAYKYFVSGKKPHSDTGGNGGIQSDCLIVSSLDKLLKNEKEDYEIIFCSNNTNDFSQSKDVSDPKLHEDIKSKFLNSKYYTNPLDMLNKEFGSTFAPELIAKMKESNEEVEKINEGGLVSPSPENIEALNVQGEVTGPESSN